MGASESAGWQGYDHQLFQDTKPQSVQLEGTAEKGATPVIRALKAKDGLQGFLREGGDEKGQELDTAWRLWASAVKAYGPKPFAGFRPFTDPSDPKKRGDFQYLTYEVFNDLVLSYGNGLRSLGLDEKAHVGLFSMNRPEWYAIHLGNLSQSYRTVALYDTLGPDAVSYITQHAELPVIVCEKDKLPALFGAIRAAKAAQDERAMQEEAYAQAPEEPEPVTSEGEAKDAEAEQKKEENVLNYALKYVVVMDYNEKFGNEHEKVSEEEKKEATDLGVTLMTLSELYEAGRGKTDVVEPSSDDIAYIMYTSGTTGNPKGVLLPHRSFAAMVASASRFIGIVSTDVHTSYLPLAHIFEAMTMQVMASAGGRAAFYQGDIRKIGKDWIDVRPTILIGVPRVFNKTYDKYKMKTKNFSSLKRWFVESAEKSSAQKIRQGQRSSFYDKAVWKNIAPDIGFDRVRLVVSGAAPLPPHIAEFMRIILPQAKVIQGYGMTENCAGCSVTSLDDYTLGHVGVPIDNMEVRLIDAPECGYSVEDKPHPRGEIQCRGLCTMVGYYKNPKKTAETIDAEGWLSTGDIGRLNPNGTFSIIDRRKNMFKTAMGEYVASEKVEQVYARASSIGQMFLYGNGFKTFVVAIVVPDAQVFETLFRERGEWKEEHTPATPEYAAYFTQLAAKNLTFIKGFILDEMRQQEAELKKFERIKDIYIEHRIDELFQGFTVANNCLTPTFKLKRPQLTRRYIQQIKDMYSANGEAPKDEEQWVA